MVWMHALSKILLFRVLIRLKTNNRYAYYSDGFFATTHFAFVLMDHSTAEIIIKTALIWFYVQVCRQGELFDHNIANKTPLFCGWHMDSVAVNP